MKFLERKNKIKKKKELTSKLNLKNENFKIE